MLNINISVRCAAFGSTHTPHVSVVCVCIKQCRVGSDDHVAELVDSEADDG